MADSTGDTSPIETRDDIGDEPSAGVRFWLGQLKLAEKEQETWVKKGRKIVERYRDERPESSKAAKFNVLWSNVETLKPILYGRTPKPDVERRHKNDDPIARLGAEILERALSYEDDLDEFDQVMECVVEDRLLPGRGTARVYYEPEFGEPEAAAETGGESQDGDDSDAYRPVTSERAPVRYVFWEDYRESPSRGHYEVWWKAYRSYMTRDELVKRFGAKIGKDVTLDYKPEGMDDDSGPQADAFKKAQVWEIWDQQKKQVVWVAPSYPDELLDTKDDPLGLPDFFPSPRPLCATQTNDTQTPVADYTQYQDQAIELDVLTARIDKLQGALKVAGVYPGASKAEIQQLVGDNTENKLIPVEDWQAFTAKGGLQGMIEWLPIEQIAKVLIQLYDARDRVLRTLYQITGMADILRGETDPNETLGAQQLKSQFATRRISKAQKDVARFARDLMRLRGFVIAKQFSPEVLAEMTGLIEPMPPLPPTPQQLIPAPMPPPGTNPGVQPSRIGVSRSGPGPAPSQPQIGGMPL